MRIGVDACCWSNRRGFGRFTREIVTHMVAEGFGHEFTLVVDEATAADSVFPKGASLVVVPTRHRPTEAASAKGARSPADLWRMSRAASRPRFDVFFFPAVYSFYPLVPPAPMVVAFHDAIAEARPEMIFPGLRSRVFWNAKTWLARRQADRLLTVSESARVQIAATFGEDASSIEVVGEGPSPCFKLLDDPSALRGVFSRHGLPEDKPLILYVGGISPHKNLEGLLRAVARLGEGDCHLALVGDHSHDAFHSCYEDLVALVHRLGLAGRVTFTGFVEEQDLVLLYNAATLLVLPSFDEGFGLPAVEAMACGLPVAASRRGALPEVLGPAGAYFEPNDTEEIASLLRRLLGHSAAREAMRQAGFLRVKDFSWTVSARRTLRLLVEVAGGRHRAA